MTTETEGAPAPDNTLAPEAEKPTPEATPEQSAEPAGEAASAEKQGDRVEEIKREVNRVQKGFDRLTAKRYAAEAEAASLRQQLSDAQHQYAELQKRSASASLDEQEDIRLDKALIRRDAINAQNKLQAIDRTANESTREMIAEKLEEAAGRIPAGVLQKLGALPLFSPQTMDFVATSDKGADLASFFADNPSEAARLHGLSPYQQGVELARLEARINVPPPRKTSNAPPPVTTINGNPGKSSKSPHEMTPAQMGEFLRGKGVLGKR